MGAQGVALPVRRHRARDLSVPMAWTSVMRRDGISLSLAHDLCRDWNRWSVAERLAAVATMLMAVVIPADAALNRVDCW